MYYVLSYHSISFSRQNVTYCNVFEYLMGTITKSNILAPPNSHHLTVNGSHVDNRHNNK